MAFKMKNPSMAKLTKAAGDNRAAMKMKKEAAAKMKKESAMKKAHADKESMAKLMDKASAMKMKEKSPMKADIPEVTVKPKKLFRSKPKPDATGKYTNDFTHLGKLIPLTVENLERTKYFAPGLSQQEKKQAIKELKSSSPAKMKKDSSMKMGHKSATKMGHKSAAKLKREGTGTDSDKVAKAFKEGPKSTKGKTKFKGGMLPMTPADIKKLRDLSKKSKGAKFLGPNKLKGARKEKFLKTLSPAKQKMNMVKGPDGKMVPDFAVDGKGANDMKSGAKMKKPMKMKKGEPMKLKKKDSAVKMVKRVEPKAVKLKEMKTQQPKPLPNKGRVTPKPIARPKPIKVKPIKAEKSPKVTARF